MAITEWSENIHELQEGEVLREWCYLEPFMWFNGSLRDYSKLLDYAFKKQYAEDMPKRCRPYEDFLENHPINFHKDDIKKNKPPSEIQLQHWSNGSNCKATIKHTWAERRISFRKAVAHEATLAAAAEYVDFIPTMIKGVKEGFNNATQIAKTEKMEGKFTSAKAESNSKAKSMEINSFRTLAGFDDAPKKQEVSMDAKVDAEAEVKTDFQRDMDEFQEKILSGKLSERINQKLAKED